MGRKLKGKDLSKKGLKGALARHNLKEEVNKKKQVALNGSLEQQKLKSKSMKSGGNKTKNNNKNGALNSKGLIPFSYDDTLLLIGEGDLSYAVSIVKQNYINPDNLMATCYDTLEEVKSKYPNVEENISFLESEGVKILYGIDANNLVSSLRLDSKKGQSVSPFKKFGKYLNYVMFNFPHTGRGMKDMDRNIRDHQKLMLNFFKSCRLLFEIVNKEHKLNSGGYKLGENSESKILLSLFEGEPYNSWGVKPLAKSASYKVERSGKFDWELFPEYHHKRTNGIRDTTKPAADRDARVYIFEEFTKSQKNLDGKHQSDSE